MRGSVNTWLYILTELRETMTFIFFSFFRPDGTLRAQFFERRAERGGVRDLPFFEHSRREAHRLRLPLSPLGIDEAQHLIAHLKPAGGGADPQNGK